MIHDNVKKAVESGNVSSLKYLFCDSLDGDPTFVAYEDDYEYCKKHEIPFVPHTELTPLTLDNINDDYWVKLKNDFMLNPSLERMEHMREFAKKFYSERIRKIEEEKARKIAQQQKPVTPPSPAPQTQTVSVEKPVVQQNTQSATPVQQQFTHTYGQSNTSSDGIRRVSEPVKHSDDGIRRVSEPVRHSDDGIRRVSKPVRHSDDGIRRVSEPVRNSDDGIRRVSEPIKYSEYQDKKTSKKADGVNPIAVLIAIVIVVIILIIINKK